MRLATLAKVVGGKLVLANDVDLAINQVVEDSRRVGSGDLFVCVPGLQVDGHDFAAKAYAQGARALVVERKLDIPLPQILVRGAAQALGQLVAHTHKRVADGLRTVGITGTNGKTTTSYLVESILQEASLSPGIMGTVSYRYAGKEIEAAYTTPTPEILQQTLHEMADAGCGSAVLEVSSAALHMDRLAGMDFEVAAFANLSQDHLDVHKTMKDYAAAKARLFRDHLREAGVAVINIDDEASDTMMRAASKHRVLRVSRAKRGAKDKADVQVVDYRSTVSGISATIDTPRGRIAVQCAGLVGEFNVDNIALAVGIAEAMKIDHRAIVRGIAAMHGVPGRVERVANDRGLHIFVDYAHTPDALDNVLAAMRAVLDSDKGNGRLLCVFGCGGDRDPTKRIAMGQAVERGADLAFLTSDNPRTEDPKAIIADVLPGLSHPHFVHVDRRVAICAAICEATPSDIVVIAGKGHEDYQILGTEKHHFDDREEAKKACELRPLFAREDVVEAAGGELVQKGESPHFQRVIIDGRIAAPGDLYVAIIGEDLDGHNYCQQAVDAGAVGILVAPGRGEALRQRKDIAIIEALDPREALGKIAKSHRQNWEGRVIGITGSSGKTTTKELVVAALSTSGVVHSAKGSSNNETGVPLTLLGLRGFHDFAVVEMGMRGLGEIDYLANLALPQVACVTNAGTAHLGRLGSVDAIAVAKGEIFGGHHPHAVAVYPQDDSRLADLAKKAPHMRSFGTDPQCDMQLVSWESMGDAGTRFCLRYGDKRADIEIPLLGEHNAVNSACAILCAVCAGADFAEACVAISSVKAPDMRGETLEVAGRKVLVDCYNANPASMSAAIETLYTLCGGGEKGKSAHTKAVAVLGDMLELGDGAARCHEEVGSLAAERDMTLVSMGEFAEKMAGAAAKAGGMAFTADDPLAAARCALASTKAGDWILLKASRGMKLERVAQALVQEAKTQGA